MRLTLELPADLASALTPAAAHLGLSLSAYTLRLLATRILPVSMPTTGAELVAYGQREGVIGTRPEMTDSQAHARQRRHSAERRAQR
jgi:hypothetical protein